MHAPPLRKLKTPKHILAIKPSKFHHDHNFLSHPIVLYDYIFNFIIIFFLSL